MKLNDGVRMAITVPDADKAYRVAKTLVEDLLRKRSVLKLEGKLSKVHLQNITLHGFNFSLGYDGRK